MFMVSNRDIFLKHITLSNDFFHRSTGGLMKQGSILSPCSDSIRVAFATWWIYITILTSFYTANLTAFLTLARFSLPINVARDILDKNQAFISQQGFAVEYAIKNVSFFVLMLMFIYNTLYGRNEL